MKSAGSFEPVTVRAASANRSSQVGSSPLAEREMRREAPLVVEGGKVVRADDHEDVRRVAGDEVHQAAHVASAAVAGVAQERRQLGRGARDPEPGRLEGRDLGGGGPGAAGDDRAGVAHPLALGRRATGDERDLRDVREVLGGPRGGLSSAAPPISPISTIASVSGSSAKSFRTSR